MICTEMDSGMTESWTDLLLRTCRLTIPAAIARTLTTLYSGYMGLLLLEEINAITFQVI